jgi:hypothetical protein
MGMVMQYVYVGGGAFNWKGVLGLNRDPVLPKALQVREQHMEALRRSISEDEEEPPPGARKRRDGEPPSEDGAKPEPRSAGGRRRRRYESGRRRGRR